MIPSVLIHCSELNTTKREILIANIEIKVHKYLSQNGEDEFRKMKNFGITSVQEIQIAKFIEDELVYVLGDQHTNWAADKSWTLVNGIASFVNGMLDSNVWNMFYLSVSCYAFANIIVKSIEQQLDTGLMHLYIRQRIV